MDACKAHQQRFRQSGAIALRPTAFVVGQLLKVVGLDFPLDKEEKMAPGPQMKKAGPRLQGPRAGDKVGDGRRRAEGGQRVGRG